MLHGVSIVEEGLLMNHCPIANFYETSSMCAFLITILFLAVYWRYKTESLGVFIFPLARRAHYARAAGLRGAGFHRGRSTRSRWPMVNWFQPMVIEIRPDQQSVIELAVQSGAYKDTGAVLDHALEIIREQTRLQGWMAGDREMLAAHIAEGYGQAVHGEAVDMSDALDILGKRRAARLK
ncbi:MAG: hypothetical protein ABSH50_12340 [Bryobacteraceae bacterium]